MDIQELKKQANEALENGDLAKAKELLAQIKSVKETEQEQKDIADELAELTTEPEVEEETAEEVTEEVAEPETEESAETEEVDEEELEKDEKGEERRMKEIQDLTSKVQDFEGYIRSQGTETRGLDTTNGAVLVPVEVSTSVLELKDGLVDLSAYVTKEAVGTGQGKFPVAKRAKAILATKSELAEIAEIDEPLFHEVDYKVETRIGQIAFSNELIEDAEISVVDYAKRQMQRMVKNTNNVKGHDKM